MGNSAQDYTLYVLLYNRYMHHTQTARDLHPRMNPFGRTMEHMFLLVLLCPTRSLLRYLYMDIHIRVFVSLLAGARNSVCFRSI